MLSTLLPCTVAMGENGHKGHSHVLENINYWKNWLADVEAHHVVGFSLSVAAAFACCCFGACWLLEEDINGKSTKKRKD